MRRYGRLFLEFLKISAFVVGGGYAIAAVADEVFGRKLKWLREGEILDNLPVISTVPGLIAGNTAIYVGLKLAGRIGAVVSLAAVAMPSFLIFLAISIGLSRLPESATLSGAFFGLRCSLAGVVAGTICRSICRGIPDLANSPGIVLAPLSPRQRLCAGLIFFATLALAALLCVQALLCFLGFGLICIGGGFPLVPFYDFTFVGACAPLLQLDGRDFSNLIALTQMTPGPVSVNAATYFGFRLGGIGGALVATVALLTPSYFLMTAALQGLARAKSNPWTARLSVILQIISISLMFVALWKFVSFSILETNDGVFAFHPIGFALAVATGILLIQKKLPIMALIFSSALIGCLWSCFS